MEPADLQRALKGRGSLYQTVEPAVLAQLATAAEQHGLAASEAAKAFDKYMIVHR